MKAMLSATGRVLWHCWPALLVWFLAGLTARYFIIQLAGLVGARSATLGMLILPLAVLVRLIGYVGMFLVVRDQLRELRSVAPERETARERRATFVDALLAGILPFYAVYTAFGGLHDDVAEYGRIAYDLERWTRLADALAGRTSAGGDAGIDVSFGVWTVLIIAIAYLGTWAWKKWSARMPRALSLVAVYLEVIWVSFAVALISDATGIVTTWVDGRMALVWLADLREWLAGAFAPALWLWDGVERLLGAAGGVILQPIAWLMIAGVIYGQTIVAEKLHLENRLIARAKARAERVPGALRRRAGDLADQVTARFRPMGRALLLMWRAGPVMIAAYVLLYTLALAIDPLVREGIVLLIGPQENTVWLSFATLIATAPLLIAEPVRMALVSGAYDATLAATRTARMPKDADAQSASTAKRTNLPSDPTGAPSASIR